jgi:hypothetical protein
MSGRRPPTQNYPFWRDFEPALTAPEANPVHPNYLRKRILRAFLGSVWVWTVDLLTHEGDDLRPVPHAGNSHCHVTPRRLLSHQLTVACADGQDHSTADGDTR